MIILEEVYKAYFDCRKHKRGTINALRFELDYENKLINLRKEIISGNYKIGKSIVFIVNNPVKREIFAADFRDRIVHHLVINRINHIFEKMFIYDSYSCRVGKGVLFGVERAKKFIRQCSENYKYECYALKLDISGFFMSINKDILYFYIEKILEEKYIGEDKDLILNLCKMIIYNDPTEGCVVKSQKEEWIGLPKTKSLFFAGNKRGLPIGNLTSQIFANVYLNQLDHFIKHNLKIRYYGRYVDDLILIHKDKEYLEEVSESVKEFLLDNLALISHRNKKKIVNCKNGVDFLGVVIKPYRTYLRGRVKDAFKKTLLDVDNILNEGILNFNEKKALRSRICSYLGTM